MGVDAGTGNFRVSTSNLSLVGVNGPVDIGRSYNSLASSAGSTSTPAANRWTFSMSGIGSLSAGSSGSATYTDGSGATWRFTPVSGTPGAYVAPAGTGLSFLTILGTVWALPAGAGPTVWFIANVAITVYVSARAVQACS